MIAPSKHLLVILDVGAVPFCHYENPHFHAAHKMPQWMARTLLAGIVRHARENQVALSFLLGETPLPRGLAQLVDTVDHAKIIPPALEAQYPDGLVVADAGDEVVLRALTKNLNRNLILRLERRQIQDCSDIVEGLLGKFRRLSIHIADIEDFGADDLAQYEKVLRRMRKAVAQFARDGYPVEVNILTDRMMLGTMRNCGAGVDHLTVAPDGQCYICPAFYYDDAASSIGSFDAGAGLSARAVASVEFSRAPLCTRCDAFHCKRCVFLNKKTTLELNVPSEQQCAIAHLEREASRQMLLDLGSLEPFRRMPRIAELNYHDPLECIDTPPLGVRNRATNPDLDPNL